MGKHTLLLIALFSFAFIGCVETLINVTVFPDGRYNMKIVSKGDKEDIDNNDEDLTPNEQANDFSNFNVFQKINIKIINGLFTIN